MVTAYKKTCVSVRGDIYDALRAKCDELDLRMSDVVESLLLDLKPSPDELVVLDGPRVAIDISPWLLELVDDARRRAREQGVEISRSDAFERAILQAIGSNL